MRKLYAGATVLLTLLAAACGDNGVRSPDFDAVLIDILVDGPSQRVVGTTAQFRALGHFTTPPSTQGAVATSDITTDSDWSVVVPVSSPANTTPEEACRLSTTPSTAATVNNVGLVTANSPGTVYIKATFRDKAGCKPFTITPSEGGGNCNVPNPPASCSQHVATHIVVVPDSQTTTPGAETPNAYCARVFFADDPNNSQEISGTTVTWTTGDTTVATVPAAPNNTGNCIKATGAQGVNSTRTTSITATATFPNNGTPSTLSDSALVIVTTGSPRSVLRVVPETATVDVGKSQEFIACGTFDPVINDPAGSTCDVPGRPANEPIGHVIDDDVMNWTSSDPTIATISDATGVATGVLPGTVTITGELEENVGDPLGKRSDTSTLTVRPAPLCTIPYLFGPGDPAQGFQAIAAAEPPSQLCLGCSIDNPGFVIDAPPATDPLQQSAETFAEYNVSAALLDVLLGTGHISMTVKSPHVFNPDATADNEGNRLGVIIQRPVSDLLLAEVLAQTSITTLSGNNDQETFSGTTCNVEVTPPDCVPGGSTGDTLAVELLGGTVIAPGIPPDEERVLIYTGHVTKPYNGLRLTFSGGLASALVTMDVFNACAQVTLPPDVENPPENP